MDNRIPPKVRLIFCFIFLSFALLIFRLSLVQLCSQDTLSKIALDQHNLIIKLLPKRGTIYDRNFKTLAFSITVDSVVCEPRRVKDRAKAARALSSILGISQNSLLEKMSQDRGFCWIKRKVLPEEAAQVRRLKLPGIDLIKEPERVYPNEELASHVIGFVGIDNNGLEGIELGFDRFLKGSEGFRWTVRDSRQHEVPGYEIKEVLPNDGLDIVLTIDEIIQNIAERELEKAYKRFNAKGGCIIVMDPFTGDVLALANRPTFDLNSYKFAPLDAKRNRAICDFFEPGSSFKIVAASAVLEEKLVKLNERFFCEQGAYKWHGHIYHDHRPHGWLTFREVIELSSNIGTMKAASRLSNELFYQYVKRFGFGRPTGIKLPGEVSGVARPPRQWSKLSLTSQAMGQEITVTAIQLAQAISVIANDGYLVTPRIVLAIQDRQGNTVEDFKPQLQDKVISEETAKVLRSVLKGVVEQGTGTSADIKDYSAAGKTGTAQKIEPNGTYSHRKFFASFIGFAPAENPRVVIVVVLDEPRPFYYGGTVAAPVFREVAGEVLRYYRVEPEGQKALFARK